MFRIFSHNALKGDPIYRGTGYPGPSKVSRVRKQVIGRNRDNGRRRGSGCATDWHLRLGGCEASICFNPKGSV